MKREVDGKILHITELISAAAVTLTSVFLILAALNVFPFSIDKCWLMAVYVCLFAISLSVALLQKNVIGIGCVASSIVLIIAQATIVCGMTLKEIYPLYVIFLPIGAVCGSCFARRFDGFFKISAALTGMGLLLFLHSLSVLPIKVVLPVLAAYFGILGVIYAVVKMNGKKYKENK